MTTKLEPQVGCILSATRVLGNKWTPLIIRDLHAGPRRFCELERSTGGINPRTLTQRLDALMAENIVEKLHESDYALTDKGRDLVPVLRSMAAWGNKYHEEC